MIFIITKSAKNIIKNYNWDLNFNSLRTGNYWYTLFSARYLEQRDIQGEQKNTDLVYVDVLCNTDIIYSGMLIDFNYSPQKDELENLVLALVTKRTFYKQDKKLIRKANGRDDTDSPCTITGDYFIVDAKQIVNINVYYLELNDPVKEDAKQDEEIQNNK